MPSGSGSVVGLTAKLGLDTDDREIDRETDRLRTKVEDATEATLTGDTDSFADKIVSSIEERSRDSKWLPDLSGQTAVGEQFDDSAVEGLSDRMAALGHEMPDQIGGAESRRTESGLSDIFGGMKGAGGKFLKVGLSGVVGLGILSKVTSLADSAPRMQKTMSMMSRSVTLFARPFFDWIARWGEDGVMNLLRMTAQFNQLYAEEGLLVALGALPELFATRGGEAGRAETAGRIGGGLTGAVGGAAAGAKLGGKGGALAGSVIPGAGTAAGGTAGAVAGGAIGGIAGLLTGAEIGGGLAERLSDIEFGDIAESIEDAGSTFATFVEDGGSHVAGRIEEAVDALTAMDWSDIGRTAMDGVSLGWDMIRWTGNLAWSAISWTGSVTWSAIQWVGSIGWDAIAWTASISWQQIEWRGQLLWSAIEWGGSIAWSAINFVGSIDISDYVTGSIDNPFSSSGGSGSSSSTADDLSVDVDLDTETTVEVDGRTLGETTQSYNERYDRRSAVIR